MKTKSPLSFVIHHSLFTIFGAACSAFLILCLTAPPTSAQDLPPLTQIVSNIMQATRPTEAYTVTVEQSLSFPQTNAPGGALLPTGQTRAAVARATTVQTFDSTFEPTKRKWMPQRALPSTAKAKGQGQTATNQPPEPPGYQVTINLEPFLESMLSSNQVTVVQETLNGRTCYKLDAKSGGISTATLWVDAEHWYVSKAIAYMMNQKFAEATCQYREVNGRWLFSKAAIAHALDGSRADLDFGEYKGTAAHPK